MLDSGSKRFDFTTLGTGIGTTNTDKIHRTLENPN